VRGQDIWDGDLFRVSRVDTAYKLLDVLKCIQSRFCRTVLIILSSVAQSGSNSLYYVGSPDDYSLHEVLFIYLFHVKLPVQRSFFQPTLGLTFLLFFPLFYRVWLPSIRKPIAATYMVNSV
jgi:hypothetical protein